MYIPYGNDNNNMLSFPELELLVILYQDNQSVVLQLWNSNFAPISLFGTDKYLVGNTKNIMCSLLRMAAFIKQQPLGNRNTKDILQIADFGFVAQKFITAIYRSSWDRLTTDNKDMIFRQYIFSQFYGKLTQTLNLIKDKQADIPRVPPPILPRPSKSVWPNQNFSKRIKYQIQITSYKLT